MIRDRALQTREKLVDKLPVTGELLRGSLLERTVRHKSGCPKCARGEGHRVYVLTVSYAGGRVRQFSVRRELVASRWSVQRDTRGHPVAILETNNNITERRQAEDALRRSDAYLAEAQRLSHTGSFGWKVSSGELYWSGRASGFLDTTEQPSLH
jgi:PAS domain-containing protein